jgi:hypothetical protein
MPNSQGLPTLEEALGAAATEVGFSEPEDGLLLAEPPTEPASPEGIVEQAQQESTAPEETDQSVFADLPEEGPAPKTIWETEVDLPGFDRPIALSEVRDGYLRQADYTRKTQALAAEKKAFEAEQGQALRLIKALADDPAGTAAYLAVQTKVIDEATVAGRVRDLREAWKPPPSREQVEAELERRVAEEVQKHPKVLEAQQRALIQSIEADFSRIEQKHSLKLTDKDKSAILKRAIDSGTPDLDLVTEAMLAQAARVRQERDQARGAAATRPTVRGPSTDSPAKQRPTIEESFAMALEGTMAE